ncbi:hypothetical protein QQF64_027461 [Cirrhinus molitorella]|uniref:Homeobox domain-containing protein n=2 Tax=Cirrhinus molitorella TaxID=172907 RepID=A0ABR3ND27_9TELE
MFSKVIAEPPLSEFEGDEVCSDLKVFVAIIFIHMRPLRDGNCGPTSAKGEEFGLMENQVLCRLHYDIMLPNLQHTPDKGNITHLDGALRIQYLPKPSKRPRTSFTSEQLQIMHTHFIQDKNPDAQMLQRLADMTGLSRRVIQVWFQNCRARQKRNPLHDSIPPRDRYQTSAMPFLSDNQYFLPLGRPETH